MKRCFAVLALLLVGCTSSQTVTTIQAVVAASEAVVEILPTIPPQVKTEVNAYLALVTAGVTCVHQELQTTDTGVARALKIAACFSAINLNQVDPAIAPYVGAVNAAMQALLAFYPTSGANTVTVSASQRVSLAALENRNAIVRGKVRAAR